MPKRDVVVIGASAGGIPALQRLLAGLPPGLPASLLVVLHHSAGPGVLPSILAKAGPLPAAYAVDGQRLTPGLVAVAQPDQHLVLGESDTLRLWRGPRENGARPAIDPLFQSAAERCGARVIAVVLSGLLDDGAAGAAAIADSGGAVLVQDPVDAQFDSMPSAAIGVVPDATVLPADKLASAIIGLVDQYVPDGPARGGRTEDADVPGEQVLLGCPTCGGGLSGAEIAGALRYRCHVGHAYSRQSLLAAQVDDIESALWTAVSKLEEHAAVQARLAVRAGSWNTPTVRERWRTAADESLRAAEVIRRQILNRSVEVARPELPD